MLLGSTLVGRYLAREIATAVVFVLVAFLVYNFSAKVIDVKFAKGQKLENEKFVKWNSFSRIALVPEKNWIVIDADASTGIPYYNWDNFTPDEKFGLLITVAVGSMWCAYAFACLALAVLPEAIGGGILTLVQWVSQTFIQLVMLSVIMVGQNILSRAADRRAEMTYQDAEATFHEAEQIQAHLAAQDEAINALLDKIAGLEKRLEVKVK